MQLAVGDRALFEFPPMGDRFVGVVTECNLPAGMLAYVSVPAGAAKRLGKDSPARVMFAREGRLVGFRAMVEEMQSGTGTMVRLVPKGELEDCDLRCEPRAACSFPAELANGKGGVQGFVVDMSLTAARMRVRKADHLPESGAHAKLRFKVFASGDVYETSCRVYRTFTKENTPFLVLEYEEPDEEFRRAVQEFVEYQSEAGTINVV